MDADLGHHVALQAREGADMCIQCPTPAAPAAAEGPSAAAAEEGDGSPVEGLRQEQVGWTSIGVLPDLVHPMRVKLGL